MRRLKVSRKQLGPPGGPGLSRRVVIARTSGHFSKRFMIKLPSRGASGSATGRNIHQKDLASALRMTKAISSITYGGHGVDAALSVYNGESDYTI